ncbi:MAG: hypothetical protein ABIF22_02595 [bacterium]
MDHLAEALKRVRVLSKIESNYDLAIRKVAYEFGLNSSHLAQKMVSARKIKATQQKKPQSEKQVYTSIKEDWRTKWEREHDD